MPLLVAFALAVLAAVVTMAGLLSTLLLAAKVVLIALQSAVESYPGFAVVLLVALLAAQLFHLRHRAPVRGSFAPLRSVPTSSLYAELARREAAEREREAKAARRSAIFRPWARRPQPPARPRLPEVRS